MNPRERQDLVEALFQEVAELPETEREAFLEAQHVDPSVTREVRELVGYHEADATLLVDTPVAPNEVASEWTESPSLEIPGYRVLRKIGEGGMGVVYEAEQAVPRRRVALKVIRLDVPSEETLRRFELEAEALARLQHSGIARIYEVGTADDGARVRPYFAMEYIEGVPLVDYAERERLETRGRLALLERICAAIEHAHQRGVIHRDLKPSNVLVDETGEPKVLDFGVARVSEPKDSLQTEAGQILGTLHYMSPEQLSGEPGSVDTRSDVYSLGVVAFQLLSGRLPHELTGKPLAEAARLILEQEAPPLGRVREELRGDVEAIVSKAVEKDKSRRYPSASQLAEDIRRFLKDETVLARKQTAFYQAVKFVRRNRPLVASTAVVLLAVVTAAVISTRQAIVATRASDEAEIAREDAQQRLEQAEEVTSFLAGMLESVSPLVKGRDVKVVDLLAEAETRFRGGIARHPLVEASLRNAIGNSYLALSLHDEARAHLERALELRRGALGESAPELAESLHSLALLELHSGDSARAEELFLSALEMSTAIFGEAHERVVSSLHGLGMALRAKSDLDEAVRRLEEARDVHRRIEGAPEQETEILATLAGIARTRGDYRLSESLHREIIEKEEQLWPDGHPNLAGSLRSFAVLLTEQGNLTEAEPLLRRALAMSRSLFGSSHSALVANLESLSSLLIKKRELEEARTLLEEGLEIAHSHFGQFHDLVAMAHDGLFRLAYASGDYDAMKRHSAKTLEIWEEVYGESSPAVARALFSVAICRQWGGHDDGAEAALKRALSIERESTGERSPAVAACLEALGELYHRGGDSVTATPYFEEALEIRRELDPSDLNTAIAASRLAGVRMATDVEEAERLIRFALAIERKVYGDEHDAVASSLTSLSVALREQGRAAEAEPLVREALEIQRKVRPPGHWVIDATECSLGGCLLKLGRLEEAEKLLPPAYERLCGSLGRENRITRSVRPAVCELFEKLERLDEAAKYCPPREESPEAPNSKPRE